MYDNEYFVVDMASCSTTGEIINSLSLALETLNDSGKKIVLKLNDSYLNQSQMLSIQALITSYGCTLDTVETINSDTLSIAQSMNILVQQPIEKRVEQIEQPQFDTDFAHFDTGIDSKESSLIIQNDNGFYFETDNINTTQFEQEQSVPSSDVQKEQQTEEHTEQPAAEVEIFPQEPQQEEVSSEPIMFDIPEEFGDAAKNTIGVYKKAYDETEITSDAWEEVDFYETPIDEPVVGDSKETTYINHTLRSGQILESDGNVVIIGDCHPGSEIRAKGDITVWGVLSGIAHAGYNGNINAKVRALKLNAVQLRIGNCYSRRPDGTNIPYIIKSSIFTPEEARVVDGEIMLFKINQN